MNLRTAAGSRTASRILLAVGLSLLSASGPAGAQTPTPPYPYETEEVEIDGGSPGIRLAGTLTIPRGSGPFPAAILLTVAGPNDRDQSFAGHRPFLVLADHLTRQGIATLRWDDRGVGGSTGDYFQARISDLADDAVAGLRMLRDRPEIDADRIGFIGNSEGAAVGPMAAVRSGDAAFVVMLAGPGRTGRDAIRGQVLRLAERQGYSEEEISAVRGRIDTMFDIVANVADRDSAAALLRSILSDTTVRVPQAAALTGGGIDQRIQLYLTPWYGSQITFDPAPALTRLDAPVLALTGSLDPVLPADQNLPAILSLLLEGGNEDVTVRVVPGVNHIFQPAETGMPAEYPRLETTFSREALEDLTVWIRDRVRADG